MTARPDLINELAEQITRIEGVSEVFSVAGHYDLAVIVRVRENEDLATVVSERIRKLDGIRTTETLIAFRVFGKAEIEAGFSLGIED